MVSTRILRPIMGQSQRVHHSGFIPRAVSLMCPGWNTNQGSPQCAEARLRGMSDTTGSESSIGVLVVEDEAVAARAHAKYVERLDGYHVAGVAKNATQAMAALTGQIYGLEPEGIHLVLLDMNLPDGHGIQVCRAIRGQRVDVDIIAVTAARDMQIVQEALSY